MNTTAIIVIVVVAIIVVGAVAVYLLQTNRTKRLRQRFGSEYARTVQETGDRRQAEAKLERLEKRVERLHIHTLEPGDRARFQDAWLSKSARTE